MFIIIRFFFLLLLVIALVYTFRYMLGGNPRHLKYAIRTMLGIVVLGILLGLAVIFVPNPPGSEPPEKSSARTSLIAQMPVNQALQGVPSRASV